MGCKDCKKEARNVRCGPMAIDIRAVQSRMLVVRNQQVLLDRDVAALYGVGTREVNQAVRNNPDKFPDGFLFRLSPLEFAEWKSKVLTSNLSQTDKASITSRRRGISWRR
mgnify:FL=1